MNDPILERIRAGAADYGPIPFWSWNDRLKPDELRAQIRNMHEIGMKGFFMHARGGLETEYLSDEWFDAVAASVDEAKRLGMEAWSYDENGWPSGFAGGALLTDPDNFARYLVGAEETARPAGEDVLGVYVIENGVCRAAAGTDAGPFFVVRERTDPSYVDVLRADVTARFLAATHEEYKRRLGGDFGGAMPGFFTDEPQYYRYAPPYSLSLPARFAEKYGYPLTDALPAVFRDFAGASAYRYDYYRLLHELFLNCFIRPIYEWCEKNGCRLTGHAVEESTLFGQMWCCGGVMPFYQYEHIPGIDYLGRGMQSDLSARQLGSACAQLGRKKALTETFACCGWDVTPRELKRIAEMQYAGGVNLMCQHLYPYSERGQRKRDYPAHYSAHNPWQPELLRFDRHFTNLGRILAEGEEEAPVLVIHPIRAAWCDYKRSEDRRSIARLEDDTLALVRFLGERQVPYHFGDEGMMETLASVEGARMRVGRCVYDTVIVPAMRTLTANTVRLLRAYQKNGGRLCFVGAVPGEIDGRAADLSDLSGNCALEAIPALSPVRLSCGGTNVPGVRMRVRRADGRRLIFAANITERDVFGASLTIADCRGAVGVEPETLREYPLGGTGQPDGSLCVSLDLPAGASVVILTRDEAAMLPPAAPGARAAALTLPETWTLTRPVTNTLVLDRVSVSVDGGKWFSEARPLERVRDNLLFARYRGPLALRYVFTVQDLPREAHLVWESASVREITLNGTPLRAGGFLAPDTAFVTADAAPHLRAGENEVVLTYDYFQKPLVYDVLYGGAMESMRNCLCFDTELENVYLIGDFRIGVDAARCADGERSTVLYDGAFPVIAPRGAVRVHDLVRDGFPFYGGAVEAETVVTWHAGEGTVFRPAGRFAAARVTVNGADAGEIFFRDEIDLAPYLTDGENRVRVRFVGALRNTAGPFHRGNPEPTGVGPRTFSYEKEWRGSACADYKERYAFVKFGI